MAIIIPAAGITFGKFRIGRKRYDYEEVSEPTGNVATRVIGNPRWSLSISSPPRMNDAMAAIWIQMLIKLGGRSNHLAMYDYVNPAPRGTMRGTMTLSGGIAAGATSCTITAGAGQAGATLKARDWLQIGSGLGSQLIMVTDDATANGSGVITVNFQNPARVAFSGGTAVTWDKPVAYYKMISDDPGFDYLPGFVNGVQGVELDLLEQWQ